MTAPAKDHITTRVSASGRCVIQIITPQGHSAVSEFPLRADAFLKIEWLRAHIGSTAPDQRGPAADRQTHTEGAGR